MSVLLNIILAFYPAALVWSFLPNIWLLKIDSFGTSDLMHFTLRFIIFAILFFISYRMVNKFISSRISYSRRGMLSFILGVISVILLALITFFQILPGEAVYTTPIFISDYILEVPYSFFAVLLPLAYLFFD